MGSKPDRSKKKHQRSLKRKKKVSGRGRTLPGLPRHLTHSLEAYIDAQGEDCVSTNQNAWHTLAFFFPNQSSQEFCELYVSHGKQLHRNFSIRKWCDDANSKRKRTKLYRLNSVQSMFHAMASTDSSLILYSIHESTIAKNCKRMEAGFRISDKNRSNGPDSAGRQKTHLHLPSVYQGSFVTGQYLWLLTLLDLLWSTALDVSTNKGTKIIDYRFFLDTIGGDEPGEERSQFIDWTQSPRGHIVTQLINQRIRRSKQVNGQATILYRTRGDLPNLYRLADNAAGMFNEAISHNGARYIERFWQMWEAMDESVARRIGWYQVGDDFHATQLKGRLEVQAAFESKSGL